MKVHVIPGTFMVWLLAEGTPRYGYITCTTRREELEIPHDARIIGIWSEEPPQEEVRELVKNSRAA